VFIPGLASVFGWQARSVALPWEGADQGRQSLLAAFVFPVLHFEINVVAIPNTVIIGILLPAQLGCFIEFHIVHYFQNILGRLGAQMLDLDLIGFKFVSWNTGRLFDFFQDADDVLEISPCRLVPE
jgi:hypothetical protein